MDANELKATIARLDAMSARCDALIAKDKPLQPDRTIGRKRLKPEYSTQCQPVASGQLAGNEMRVRPGYRPQKPTFVDVGDGSLDAIFADFEAAFDEMAQAHRA